MTCADASSFHIQGNTHNEKKLYALAAKDYCYATRKYIEGGDERNGQRTLNVLIKQCLPNICKDNYEKDDLDDNIKLVLDCLNLKNQNGRYGEHIHDLTKEIKNAKLRETIKATS